MDNAGSKPAAIQEGDHWQCDLGLTMMQAMLVGLLVKEIAYVPIAAITWSHNLVIVSLLEAFVNIEVKVKTAHVHTSPENRVTVVTKIALKYHYEL